MNPPATTMQMVPLLGLLFIALMVILRMAMLIGADLTQWLDTGTLPESDSVPDAEWLLELDSQQADSQSGERSDPIDQGTIIVGE